MKLVGVGVAALVLATGACVENPGAGPDSAASSAAALQPASSLRFERRVPASGPPKVFTLDVDQYVTPEEFLKHHAPAIWKLGPADELRPGRTIEGSNGHIKTDYQQFHAGYQVEGGRLSLTTRNGHVVSGGGKPMGGLANLEVQVLVPKDVALARGRARAGAACNQREPLSFVIEPRAALLIAEKNRRLVWRVGVVLANPWAEWTMSFDAATGAVLADWGGMGVNGELPGCSPPSDPIPQNRN